MEITVRLAGALRPYAGGVSQLVVDVDDGGPVTVEGVLDVLDRDHPAVGRRVRDEQRRLRRHVNVFVGPDNCKDAGGLETAVPGGTEVSIMPAISGGSGGP